MSQYTRRVHTDGTVEVLKTEDALLEAIGALAAVRDSLITRRDMTIVQLRLFKLKHPELSEYWDALETLIR